LGIALQKGYKEEAQALSDAMAVVNARSEVGRTALIAASIRGDVRVVQALLAAGADVNAKTDKCRTALIGASSYPMEPKILSDDSRMSSLGRVVAYYVTAGVTTTEAQSKLRRDHLETVVALLVAKADVNAKADNGFTALMAASESGDPEIARTLLAAKADINAKTDDGRTALMEASISGNPEVVIALLNAGADVNAKTEKGETALILAKKNHHEDIMRLLRIANGADN
jgi:ankyrin repeat protein